jgi:hypothetical protein
MRALARLAAIVIAAGMCGAVAAQTTDRPISAESLIVRRSASGVETVTFLSKDPNFLFPPIGSVDDPSRPSNGTELSLFPQSQGGLGFSYGVTGGAMWKSKDGAVDEYHYRYPQGPQGIKSVLLKETKRIKVRIRGTSPPFSGPYGGFFVRLTTGSLRNCAFFDASTIRRDDGTRFEARDAAAPSVSDCESFPGATTTTTTLPYPPCTGGAGYPTCDGTCPGTDECGQHIEGGFQTCACFPAGVIRVPSRATRRVAAPASVERCVRGSTPTSTTLVAGFRGVHAYLRRRVAIRRFRTSVPAWDSVRGRGVRRPDDRQYDVLRLRSAIVLSGGNG